MENVRVTGHWRPSKRQREELRQPTGKVRGRRPVGVEKRVDFRSEVTRGECRACRVQGGRGGRQEEMRE